MPLNEATHCLRSFGAADYDGALSMVVQILVALMAILPSLTKELSYLESDSSSSGSAGRKKRR